MRKKIGFYGKLILSGAAILSSCGAMTAIDLGTGKPSNQDDDAKGLLEADYTIGDDAFENVDEDNGNGTFDFRKLGAKQDTGSSEESDAIDYSTYVGQADSAIKISAAALPTDLKVTNASSSLDLLFKVTNTTEYATSGVLCWSNPYKKDSNGNITGSKGLSDYTYGSDGMAIANAFSKEYSNYFDYKGASFSTIADYVYARAYYVDSDNVAHFSNLVKYSVLDYCYNKKGKTSKVGTTDVNLGDYVNSLLTVGIVAGKDSNPNSTRYSSSEFKKVVLSSNSGRLDDGFRTGLYNEYESVELNASNKNMLWDASSMTTYNGSIKMSAIKDAVTENNGTYNVDFSSFYGVASRGLIIEGGVVKGLTDDADPNVVIPSGATSILSSAFKNNTTITSVNIPVSVTSMGEYAFSGCTNLQNVTIPSSVTSIGNYAFSGCANLQDVTIPSSVTSIGNYAFSGCANLQNVTIPSSVTSIGDYAFCNCLKLATLNLSNKSTKIGIRAFYGCKNLSNSDYGFSVSDFPYATFGIIGAGAFGGIASTNLKTVTGYKKEIISSSSGVKVNVIPTVVERYPYKVFACSDNVRVNLMGLDRNSFEDLLESIEGENFWYEFVNQLFDFSNQDDLWNCYCNNYRVIFAFYTENYTINPIIENNEITDFQLTMTGKFTMDKSLVVIPFMDVANYKNYTPVNPNSGD